MEAENLTSEEIAVLKAITETAFLPNSEVDITAIKRHVDKNGITNTGFNVAVRGLRTKDFIHISPSGEELILSEAGWAWIEENQSQFPLRFEEKEEALPFLG